MTSYRNPLAQADDLTGFRMEGPGAVSFPQGRLRLESSAPVSVGQDAHVVLWCPWEAPAMMRLAWDFWPLHSCGLCIVFFHARGHHGMDLFDPAMPPRSGRYQQYFDGPLDTYHLAYYRRRYDSERRLHLCNLRKSHGHHLVAQAGDPLPELASANGPYHLVVEIRSGRITFMIDDIPVLDWVDDGSVGGPPLLGGRVGLRQMAPMIAEYANLVIEPLR